MAIVDLAYYTTVYLGQDATDCEFPALEARAEDVIGSMTHWKVTADTIASLPPFQRTLVKKAICAQVDFFALNGTDVAVGGVSGGFTVGKVSVKGSVKTEKETTGAMAANISPLTLMYLEQTGLMNPQVPVAPDLMGGWNVC